MENIDQIFAQLEKTVGNVFDFKHQIDNEIDYRKVLGRLSFPTKE